MRFVDSRKAGYKSEAYFYDGLLTLTQLMTIAVVVFGAVSHCERIFRFSRFAYIYTLYWDYH